MKIHIVQKGDTLWTIAKKYNVNFEELKKLNTQISNPEMIMPGMKIKIPVQKQVIKQESPKISLQGNKKEVMTSGQDKFNQLAQKEQIIPTKEKIVSTKEQIVPTKEKIVPTKEQIVPAKEQIVPTKEIPKPITMPKPPVQQPVPTPTPTPTPKTKAIPIPIPIPIPVPKSTPVPKAEPKPTPTPKEKIVEPKVETPIKQYIPKMQQEKPKVTKQKVEIVIKEKVEKKDCEQMVDPCDIPCIPIDMEQCQPIDPCHSYPNWQVSPHQVQPIMCTPVEETMNCLPIQEVQEHHMKVAQSQMNTKTMQPSNVNYEHSATHGAQSWDDNSMKNDSYGSVQTGVQSWPTKNEQEWSANQNNMHAWSANQNEQMNQVHGHNMEEDCGCQNKEETLRDPSLMFQPYPMPNMQQMHSNDHMPPHMQNQMNQMPSQMQNQMNPMPQHMQNQMNPMMPQQMQNQMNPMPQHMQNQMNPMMPSQMQNQMNPMPPHMQNQMNQMPTHMQNQMNQMPQHMQNQMNPMPSQMQNQMNPMMSPHMQNQMNQMPPHMPNQMNTMIPNQMQGPSMQQPYQPLVYPPQYTGLPNFNFEQELPQTMPPEYRGQPTIPQIPPFGYMNQEQRGGQQMTQQQSAAHNPFGNQTAYPQSINPFSNQPNDRK